MERQSSEQELSHQKATETIKILSIELNIYFSKISVEKNKTCKDNLRKSKLVINTIYEMLNCTSIRENLIIDKSPL